MAQYLAAGLCLMAVAAQAAGEGRIRPWPKNPWFWEYKGSPVLLVGGSDDDNLFQWLDAPLREQLDRLKRAGGNYVRNTMSDRKDKDFEVYPFFRRPDGKYDLERWNPEYWERFERFLKWTGERDIIVQIEVWDRFDYSTRNWPPHPYNPANNINYTFEASGFAPEYPLHPGRNVQPFFFTTPEQRNNAVVYRYQRAFVEKMLSHSLKYGHVLYCMDNETNGEAAWGRHWAGVIKAAAKKAGVAVSVTEMWDAWDLKKEEHRRTFDHPEIYDFVDISQNNHNDGDRHWANALWVREYLAARPRPMNTVKTYGANGSKYGPTDDHGLSRVFRHVLVGVAGARFHRPESGLGLNAKSEAAIRAVRKMETVLPAWERTPRMDLLEERETDEAHAAAGSKGYAVYFPNGGAVRLKVPAGRYRVRWIDGGTGVWGHEARAKAGAEGIVLAAPGQGHWLAVVTR